MKRKATNKSGSGNRKSPSEDRKDDKKGGDDREDEEESEESEEDDEEESEDDAGDDEEEGEKSGKKPDKKDSKDKLDLEALPDEAKAYIKSLRKENAKYRTRARNSDERYNALSSRVKGLAGGGDDDEELTLEERVSQAEAHTHSLAFENQVFKVAIQHGIADADAVEYLQFVIGKEVGKLDDGEELDDDAITEIVERVKAKFKVGGGAGGGKTSVNDSKGGKKKPEKGDEVTLEVFKGMNTFERSELYRKNPDLYSRLQKEAKAKRILV